MTTSTDLDLEAARESLRATLAGHEQELAEAERDLGAAELDGHSTTAAAKRIEAARGGIARASAALAERERRHDADEAGQAELAAARRLAEAYPRLAAFFRDVVEMLRLNRAAEEARAHVVASGRAPLVAGMDEAIAKAARVTLERPQANNYRPFGQRSGLNEDYFTRLAQRADELAAEARETVARLTES